MKMQHVRYFLAICDELNFTRAAKKCGVAQPSLTNAIRRLEREVGGALFLRSTRAPHVQLSALGLQLFPICVQMNELLEKAKSLVSESQNCRMVADGTSRHFQALEPMSGFGRTAEVAELGLGRD